MKTKHTPGEWTLSNNFDIEREKYVPEYRVQMGSAKRSVSISFPSHHYFADAIEHQQIKEEAETNAKLIAAAPELLEALNGITKFNIESLGANNELLIAIRNGKKAIKKATE